ncbi:unnamed protein product [Moneuplotes crassus]|uniref:J domain-containing protein n=1 Tax=Euplotes crassus TaxID=5936 RepID=A0AAD1UPG9_EUPCR|nr:unnamed protein product [Moneuplotes crassus]
MQKRWTNIIPLSIIRQIIIQRLTPLLKRNENVSKKCVKKRQKCLLLAFKDSTTEEEEEEETEKAATGANTGKTAANTIFGRFKVTEEIEIGKFETTSMSQHAESDNFSLGSDGLNPDTTLSSNIGEFIPVGERLASLYKGTLISRETQNGRGGSKGLRFKCSNNHEFTISYGRLGKVPTTHLTLEACKDIWCVKCHNFYYRCKTKANQNGAVVTSSIFEAGHVRLNCRMGHDFKISIHRNPDKVWCSHCKKMQKEELLRQKEIELERKKQLFNEQQRRLFKESKNNFQEQQSHMNQNQATIQDILRQVELKAKAETQKFMTENKTELNESKVFNVYKTIYIPSEILQASLQSLGGHLNSCFRKMAVLLHPDKNSHPLSNRAFQKLSQAYIFCQEKR